MTKGSSVFVVGDSISLGYGPYLRDFLGEAFCYARKTEGEPGISAEFAGANGKDSRIVRGYLTARSLDRDFAPDLLLLNCGLHDIKRDAVTDVYQVPLDDYETNLRTILALLADRETRVIWVRTTPVSDAHHNPRASEYRLLDADVQRYNAAADAIMTRAGVPKIDLYHFVQQLGPDWDAIYRDNVHYTPEVARAQGAFVAGFVRGLLEPKTRDDAPKVL